MEISKIEAILSLDSTAVVTVRGETVEWISGAITEPTDLEITTEQARLQAEYDAKDWERNRQAEYPSLEDCIHALLDGGDTLTDLQALRTQVKSDNPKPA
tara:strand:- start:897 stop:1196 length:300 start_codon:yes stop_codon:yes gene_type:complete